MFFHDKERGVFIDLSKVTGLRVTDAVKYVDTVTGEEEFYFGGLKVGHNYDVVKKFCVSDCLYTSIYFDSEEEAREYFNKLVEYTKGDCSNVLEYENGDFRLVSNTVVE